MAELLNALRNCGGLGSILTVPFAALSSFSALPKMFYLEFSTISAALILFAAHCFSAEERTFKLPRLILHADQFYLIRKKEVDLSCQIEPGWREATMSDVQWMKDGVAIEDIAGKNGHGEYIIEGPTLRILSGRYHDEGDYQCSALIQRVRLKNSYYVNTRLVSAPVKLRRARITKFDKVLPETVSVLQGHIARLPCSGMPDVIPGPPLIWFEKEGNETALGLSGDSRFLATPAGMQVGLARFSDSGNYYCVVKNMFTNQTRKSPYAVQLEVHPRRNSKQNPTLIYPSKISSPSTPIVVDVVKGQTVLLECIIAYAKIVWTRGFTESSGPKGSSFGTGISLTNDKAKFRLLWGNLRIREVNEGDSGTYACESSSVFSEGDVDGYPKVFYKVQVHAPTDVQLILGQLGPDKSWQLSCLALNLHYEIPMVYMNGLALIEAMDKLGIPPHTNFFTNPINVTLSSGSAPSGSVQCMSRPAMVEAEVYGIGLERGRAMNVYVDNLAGQGNLTGQEINLISQGPENSTRTVGETATLTCVKKFGARTSIWIKDNKRVSLYGGRTKLIGSGSLQITDIKPEDEGWYTCEVTDYNRHKTKSSAYLKVLLRTEQNDGLNEDVVGDSKKTADVQDPSGVNKTAPFVLAAPKAFVTGRNIRMHWTLPETVADKRRVESFKVESRTEDGEWTDVDELAPHVKAKTIRALTPGNRYQFRVSALLSGRMSVVSEPTEWLLVEPSAGGITLPSEPQMWKMVAESDTSLRLQWNHSSLAPVDVPRKFIISYGKTSTEHMQTMETDGRVRQVVIRNLDPSSEYKATVIAENEAGRSQPSQAAYARTNATLVASAVNANSTSLLMLFIHSFSRASNWNMGAVAIALVTALVTLLLLLTCCFLWCSVRQKHAKKVAKAAKGKFVDTSHRIFNEQRVQKTRLYHDVAAMSVLIDDVDECSPLKSMHTEDRPTSVASLKSFPFGKDAVTMPNLYGGNCTYYNDDQDPSSDLTQFQLMSGYAGATKRIPAYNDIGDIGMNMSVCNGGSQYYSRDEVVRPRCSPRRLIKVVDPTCPGSVVHSPPDSSPSVTDSNSAAGGVISTGSVAPRPFSRSPVTESVEDDCLRIEVSSRNSQISSNDSRFLHTFKSNTPNTTSFICGTFGRRRDQEGGSHETTPFADSGLAHCHQRVTDD